MSIGDAHMGDDTDGKVALREPQQRFLPASWVKEGVTEKNDCIRHGFNCGMDGSN